MSENLRRIIESKRAMRTKLAALSFGEKILILEKMRDRTRGIITGRTTTFGKKIQSGEKLPAHPTRSY